MTRISAKTTMPRISKTTPVLLTSATSRTPKMLSKVVLNRTSAATLRSVLKSVGILALKTLLMSGISTSGTVATTAATVSTPANRSIDAVTHEDVRLDRYLVH